MQISTQMDLLSQLEIKHPLFLAPMAGISTPKLAAIVSNMGGLGSLGLGSSSVDEVVAQIEQTKALTSNAFQVNFFCHDQTILDVEKEKIWINFLSKEFKELKKPFPSQLNQLYNSFLHNEDYTNIILDKKPKAISFHFGLPSKAQLNALKSANIITMVSVTQISEALVAQNLGIDVLIAQGIEAGGHRGVFNEMYDPGIFTHDLVHLLTQSPLIQLPVVAAGGLMTGHDIRNILDLGASAAQLGTAFIQCKESAAHDHYRAALFEKNITQITSVISGRPARGLIRSWHTQVDTPNQPNHPDYPFPYDIAKQLSKINQEFAIYWAGSNFSKIRRLDAEQLMQTLIQEITQLS